MEFKKCVQIQTRRDASLIYLPLATDDEFLEPVSGQFDGIHGVFRLGQPLVLKASLGRQP